MVKGHVAPTFAAHGALPRGQSAHTHLATMPTEHHATTRFLGDPANVTRARFRLYQPNLSPGTTACHGWAGTLADPDALHQEACQSPEIGEGFGLTRRQAPRQSRLDADGLRRQMAKLSAAAKLTHAR